MNDTKGKLVALFDLDGTLVNTDAVNFAAYCKVLDRAGIHGLHAGHERVTKKKIQTDVPCLSGGDIEAIAKAKQEEYIRLLWNSDLGPAAEALRVVLASRDMFSKVVLLTDAQEQRAVETLRFHELDRCFDEIVCNAGQGDKYLNYFKHHDANPAVTIVVHICCIQHMSTYVVQSNMLCRIGLAFESMRQSQSYTTYFQMLFRKPIRDLSSLQCPVGLHVDGGQHFAIAFAFISRSTSA